MEAEKGSTVRSSSPVGGIETARRVTDLFAAIVGLLVVATTIINMASLPMLLGLFEVPVFNIPGTCDGIVAPLNSCLLAYINMRWQLGVFSFWVMLAALFAVGWAFRHSGAAGALHTLGDLIAASPLKDAHAKLMKIVPVATWFFLGMSTLGMAGILGFSTGIICFFVCLAYIILAAL